MRAESDQSDDPFAPPNHSAAVAEPSGDWKRIRRIGLAISCILIFGVFLVSAALLMVADSRSTDPVGAFVLMLFGTVFLTISYGLLRRQNGIVVTGLVAFFGLGLAGLIYEMLR